jgi:FAD/FMN-containing dehydrogenase
MGAARGAEDVPEPLPPLPLEGEEQRSLSRVAPTATAFAHRDQHFEFTILSRWTDPSESAANIQWTRAFFEAMQAFVEHGGYVNDLSEFEDGPVRAAYGCNYERLVAIKRKYDPSNVFRMNHNIKP